LEPVGSLLQRGVVFVSQSKQTLTGYNTRHCPFGYSYSVAVFIFFLAALAADFFFLAALAAVFCVLNSPFFHQLIGYLLFFSPHVHLYIHPLT